MEGLKRHMKTHRYSSQTCKECHREFKSEKDLKRHKTLNHTCKICKTVFIHSTDLETHKETSLSCSISKPRKTIFCDKCQTEYENKKLYKEHLISTSSKTCSMTKIVELYSCDACIKVFTSKPKYTKHMKTHSVSITLPQPSNDNLKPSDNIKHEPHSSVKIEDKSDSNMAREFKMTDPDSSSSESETADLSLAGTVKVEPITEESADLNLAENSVFVDCCEGKENIVN